MKMQTVYQVIAKRYGVSIAEIEKDMQNAIDYAYKKSDKKDSEKLMQKMVNCKGSVPTTDEFIQHVSKQIRETKN